MSFKCLNGFTYDSVARRYWQNPDNGVHRKKSGCGERSPRRIFSVATAADPAYAERIHLAFAELSALPYFTVFDMIDGDISDKVKIIADAPLFYVDKVLNVQDGFDKNHLSVESDLDTIQSGIYKVT